MEPVVVIGSGFGGLAAAVRMRVLGYPVVILEALQHAGGRAQVFTQDGFTFDAGPTVITAPYLFEELFEAAGRDWRDYFEMIPVDPFYRIKFDDGSQFETVGDEERLIANIRELSPQDVDGYRKLAEHARRIFDIGYTELADVPFGKVTDMLKVIPDMMRLENYRSVYSLVSKYIKDERLRKAFTYQPLLIGGNPFRATSIYLLIHWIERKWGVHYARGGTTTLVKALTDLLEELGVAIHYNAPVEEIEVKNGCAIGVRLEDGRRFSASFVVSNADPTITYGKLIAPENRRKYTNRKVGHVKNSMSLFVAYIGTNKVWKDQAHHTIMLGPRYKSLLDDIFDKKVLASDFSLYVHSPTSSDPSVAPDGHGNMYVLAPVPNTKSGIDWGEVGPEYYDRILKSLEARMLPGLRESIVTSKVITPSFFEDTLRSADGAAFGPEPTLQQSAWFRYHNESEDVKGLYFVGAGTHPGAGVPGVLCSAKVLERVVPRLSPSERLAIPAR